MIFHGNDTDPDYAVVFPEAKVNTTTLTISPENWQAMQADMTTLYGEFGTRSGGGPSGGRLDGQGGGPGAGQPPGNGGGAGGVRPVGGGVNVDDMFPDENPIWVAVDVEFDRQTWTNVGMRYKGNSSLSGSWGEGSLKLPFRLDF